MDTSVPDKAAEEKQPAPMAALLIAANYTPPFVRRFIRSREIGLTIFAGIIGVLAAGFVALMSAIASLAHEVLFGVQPGMRLSELARIDQPFVPVFGGLLLCGLTWFAGKMLGGGSALNGMVYTRGTRYDYDGWAAAGCTGWSWNDVYPYFLRSENFEGPPSQTHGRLGHLVRGGGPLPRAPGPRAEGGVPRDPAGLTATWACSGARRTTVAEYRCCPGRSASKLVATISAITSGFIVVSSWLYCGCFDNRAARAALLANLALGQSSISTASCG